MLCALIMAGGKGERFWPLSTDERPKQFLRLFGEESMIQMTVKRLKHSISAEHIFIVTGEIYKDLIHEQLPEIPERNIIMEPVGRNTAPCIALSSLYIKQLYKDAVIAVLPSDHLINNGQRFLELLQSGEKFINKNPKAIVTIGISPDRPETGYGYIKYTPRIYGQVFSEEAALSSESEDILRVESFVEKPSREKANEYINQGNYLWNAGMFIWRADHVLELTKLYLKSTYDILMTINTSNARSFHEDCKEKYPLVESISVDYGIMEKAKNIFVIPGDFGWDDVGSWFAVERYSQKDEKNNVHKGEVKSIDSKENLVISSGKPIVMVGVENLLVVESNEMIFVCSKEYIDSIRDIKKKVQNR